MDKDALNAGIQNGKTPHPSSMPLFLPETCPDHGTPFDSCCLSQLLIDNGLKREDVVLSPHFGWVKTKGYEPKLIQPK